MRPRGKPPRDRSQRRTETAPAGRSTRGRARPGAERGRDTPAGHARAARPEDRRRAPAAAPPPRTPRTPRTPAREPRRPPPTRPAAGPPLAGPWLWTTRQGAEGDLAEELVLALGAGAAEVVAPALVRSRAAPTRPSGGIDLTFARCGFRELGAPGSAAERTRVAPAERAFELLRPHLAAAPCWALDAFVPDTDLDNPLVEGVGAIGRELIALVAARAPEVAARRVELAALRHREGIVALLCLATSGLYVGSVGAAEALGLAPGGRSRVRVPGDKPSRAARKLEEAFAWFGVGPAPGELCVDLGAAPGGWSWLLLERGARVVAVDPARMRPDLTARRALRHVQDSAFRYEHERDDPFATGEPADWLCCDMAWRPLEVAALLAKWGRRGGARLLVANLKLPMKRKAEMVARLRGIVAEGGWREVRTRQLYHDREEVTLVAHR